MGKFWKMAMGWGGALGILGAGLGAGGAELRSGRRGVSANYLTAEQAELLAPGVSWVYNWGATPGNLVLPAGTGPEFVPMVWGNSTGTLEAVRAYLEGGARPQAVLVLNEPNLRGQAFLTPEVAAQWMVQVRQTLQGYGVPLIGPQMSLGSTPESSITAWDPVQGREVTYTTMAPYLDALDHYLGETRLEGVAVHPYGNAGELRWAVETIQARYGKPVWVTEFAFWDAPDAEAVYSYLVEALDFLEHSPLVAGYAWFKADLGSRHKLSLLQTSGAELTRLGRLYVNYPAFDPTHAYPVPGRVQAESYLGRENLTIAVAEEETGMGALYAGRTPGWAEYRINPAVSGTYRLRVRLSSTYWPSLPAAESPTLPDPPSGIQRDVLLRTRLEAGPQVFRLLLSGLNAKIDWLEWERVE